MKNNSLKFNISNLLSKILKSKNKSLRSKLNINKNLNETFYNLNNIKKNQDNKNLIKKLSYFDSYNQTKQNKELIKFKPINIKNLSDSNFLKKDLYSKYISKTKLLNLIFKSFKLLNKNLILYVKKNNLNSILNILNKTRIKNFNKITNFNNINKRKLIKNFKHIKLNINNNLYNNNYNNLIIPLKLKRTPNRELETEIKLKKLISKNKTNYFYFLENKNNKNFLFKNKILINVDSKKLLELKTSIFNFKSFNKINELNNFSKTKTKLISNINPKNSKITKEIIKKYINSKIIFNSNIANLLSLNNNYNFYKYNKLTFPIINKISEFLQRSFMAMSSLISKPVFVNTPDKIIIQLFYLFLNRNKYIKKNSLSKGNIKIKYNQKEKQINTNLFENNIKSILILENKNKLNIICNILTRFFKKPIELELIRVYYPYYNSNILVNLFGIFINKIKLRRIFRRFIDLSIENNYSKIFGFKNKFLFLPKKLSGIKIKVAGRILTQRVIPRRTVKIVSAGALNKTKSTLIETARFTNKNKRGAFSITISIGHRLYSTGINPCY
jgi:hypothetical protein